MSPKEFIDLVGRMRTAQRAYIRSHSFGDLYNSENLAREVDQALRDFSNPKNQLSLFPSAASQ